MATALMLKWGKMRRQKNAENAKKAAPHNTEPLFEN
jgi:hypothetical protein